MAIYAPLLSVVGPLLLWPIELILPYPFIVEEIFKAVIVYLILEVSSKKSQEKLVIASAILFSLSESVLYIFNISLVGNINDFILRFIITTIMHTSTFLVIYLLGRINTKYLALGVLTGATIHYFYNLLVGSFL